MDRESFGINSIIIVGNGIMIRNLDKVRYIIMTGYIMRELSRRINIMGKEYLYLLMRIRKIIIINMSDHFNMEKNMVMEN